MCPNGVDVVYDSIGTAVETSIAITKVFGHVVPFGLAGGKLELGDPLAIIAYSKTITGSDLWSYLTSGEERIKRAGQFFEWIISGKIKVSPPTIFRLSEGKKAHDYMEERKSTGKVLMIP